MRSSVFTETKKRHEGLMLHLKQKFIFEARFALAQLNPTSKWKESRCEAS